MWISSYFNETMNIFCYNGQLNFDCQTRCFQIWDGDKHMNFILSL